MEVLSTIQTPMEKTSTVRDLIDLWPTRAALAEDISARCEDRPATPAQVHKWAASGSIPSRFHWAVVQSGLARGFDVSADLIVQLHAPQKGAA